MKKRAWAIIPRSGADIQIAEFKVGSKYKGIDLWSYEEAKQQALSLLRAEIRPYLERISDLESDRFAETRTIPLYKAWHAVHLYQHIVVTAKTKKRAIQMLETTAYSFNKYWNKCWGRDDFWYELGHQEALWVKDCDCRGNGPGDFHQVLGDARKQIVELRPEGYYIEPIDEFILELNGIKH